MTAFVLRSAGRRQACDPQACYPQACRGPIDPCARRPMPRFDDAPPPLPERIVDFALCLILAVAVVGLLLLAL